MAASQALVSAFRGFTERINRVFLDDSSWMEFSSGATCLVWAVVGMIDPRPLEHWASMRLITDRMAPEVWLAISLALGLLQIGTLLWRRTTLRGIVAFLSAWWWSYMALTIYISVGSAPSVVVYAGWALPNLLAVWKHAQTHISARAAVRGG